MSRHFGKFLALKEDTAVLAFGFQLLACNLIRELTVAGGTLFGMDFPKLPLNAQLLLRNTLIAPVLFFSDT